MIDGLVFTSEEQIREYRDQQQRALDEKFAGALGRKPTMREQELSELAEQHDREKRKDGWT